LPHRRGLPCLPRPHRRVRRRTGRGAPVRGRRLHRRRLGQRARPRRGPGAGAGGGAAGAGAGRARLAPRPRLPRLGPPRPPGAGAVRGRPRPPPHVHARRAPRAGRGRRLRRAARGAGALRPRVVGRADGGLGEAARPRPPPRHPRRGHARAASALTGTSAGARPVLTPPPATAVIPRELFQKIRHVEVRTKGLVENVFGGEYHSAFRGRGIELSEVRPYQIGDDVRAVEWNVSGRTGEACPTQCDEQREQTLHGAVVVAGREGFGSGGRAKRELAAELCAVLGFSAIRNNDKVGLLLFSDRVERFVPPKKGRRHVLRLVRDLYVHRPQSRGTSIRAALDHALHVLRRRAIVVLVSDFLAI